MSTPFSTLRLLPIYFALLSTPALSEGDFDFAFQASYDQTPLGLALEFAANGEGYIFANARDYDHIIVTGAFEGDTIEDLLDDIASFAGNSIQYTEGEASIF